MFDAPEVITTFEADGLDLTINVSFAPGAPVATLIGCAVQTYALPVNGGASVAGAATILSATSIRVRYPAWSLRQNQWEIHTQIAPPGAGDAYQTVSREICNVARSAAPRPPAVAPAPPVPLPDEPVLQFPTRAAFVTANAANPGLGLSNGEILWAGGFAYMRQAGATELPSLSGFVPDGMATVFHYGAAGGGVTNDTSAFQSAGASGRYVFVPRGSYNLTANVTGLWEFENGVTFSGAGIATKNLRFITRGAEAAHTRGFDYQHRFQGTVTGSGRLGHNSVLVDDTTNSGTQLVAGTQFLHTIRPGMQGTRYALHSVMQVVGTKLDGGFQFYQADVSQASYAWSSANQGGNGVFSLGQVDQGYKGELFAGNDNAWLAAGATFYRNLVGREINVSIFSGASAYSVFGLLIAGKESELAFEDHAMIGLTSANQTFRHGITFGLTWGEETTGGWPIRPDGTLIGITRRKYPNVFSGSYGAAYGIDFREATFTDAAFASTGFTVDGDGDTRTRTLAVTDGVTAPAAVVGQAIIYVDAADGDLKVRFGDGITKTLATDT